jgi:hypothetical protein
VDLNEARKAFYEFSGTASGLVRQLAFAGIAIVWVFKSPAPDGSALLPRGFLWPGVFLVVTLACDLLQYIAAAASWGIFARSQELAGVDDDTEIDAPRWINWPQDFFYVAKVIAVMCAYVLLGRYLLTRLF